MCCGNRPAAEKVIVGVNVLLGLLAAVVIGLWFWYAGPARSVTHGVNQAILVFPFALLLLSLVGCCAGSQKAACHTRTAQIVYMVLTGLGLVLCAAALGFGIWSSSMIDGIEDRRSVAELTDSEHSFLRFMSDQFVESYRAGECEGGDAVADTPSDLSRDIEWTEMTCAEPPFEAYPSLVNKEKAPSQEDRARFWGCVAWARSEAAEAASQAEHEVFCRASGRLLRGIRRNVWSLFATFAVLALLEVVLLIATISLLVTKPQPSALHLVAAPYYRAADAPAPTPAHQQPAGAHYAAPQPAQHV